jgi:hypothetical protein
MLPAGKIPVPPSKANQNQSNQKPMQTMLDTKTRPRSLDEARAHLSQLRKTATERKIRLPASSDEIPRTLDRAKSMIIDFELALAGATSSVIPPSKTEPIAPASKSSESLFSEAGAIATKYQRSSSRLPELRPSSAVDARDLTRTELRMEIESQRGNREKLGALFGELRRRERGEPSRRSIELASNASDEQLEALIDSEKNVERRQELFQILIHRARKN